MKTPVLRWLGGLLALAVLPATAADRPWRMATTPQYLLISQTDERDTREWMRGFDQFILSTSSLLKLDQRALPPLTVVLFDSDKDYTPYKPRRPDGQTASVAGQFIRRPTWSVIGMSHEERNEELHRTIYHEATHWLMSTDQARTPAWFTEGIAELFSTFERHGDKVNWAKPIERHLDDLQNGTMPLQQFLIEPSALFNRDDRQQLFYAQAWAFTHFLMFSDNSKRRPLMARYLDAFRSESGDAAVAAVFGDQLPQVEHDFHLFLDQHGFHYVTYPVLPAPDPPALQPAPAVVVEAALGLLALGAQRRELAQQHAERAIALDAGSPGGYEVLAYLALEGDGFGGDFDGAAKQAEAALQRGSKDSELFVLMGDSYARGDNSNRPNAEQARVNMYENAINLNPYRLEVYQRLAEALFQVDKPREEDLRFLNLGLRAFPGEDWLKVGAAAAEYRLGRQDDAMAALDRALRPEGTLDALERNNAVNLRRSWLVNAMNGELQAATAARDPAAVRAVVARYRERLGDVPEIMTFLNEVEAGLKQMEQPAPRGRKK